MISLPARPEAVDIDPSRTALLVVDMQNAFAKPGGMLDLVGADIAGAAGVIDANRRLVSAFREAGLPVIFLAMTYRADLSDAGGPASPNFHKELGIRLMRERPEHWGKLLVDGTWDWQIVDELEPMAGEIVLRKPRYSGFAGTNLDNVLRDRDVRYVVVSGIATNVCVESTVRDAFFREYWPVVVEDAVNHTGPDFCRDASLWNFEHLFGWVAGSDAVIEALQSGRA